MTIYERRILRALSREDTYEGALALIVGDRTWSGGGRPRTLVAVLRAMQARNLVTRKSDDPLVWRITEHGWKALEEAHRA